jgi:hypothetical protein
MIFRSGEMGAQGHKEKLPGLFEYYELLSKVVPPAEDFVLQPEKHADGEHTVPHLYPPEWPKSQPAPKSPKLGVRSRLGFAPVERRDDDT